MYNTGKEQTIDNEYIDILSFAVARCNDAGETRYIYIQCALARELSIMGGQITKTPRKVQQSLSE